jgi:hypothetical protein
MDAQDERAMDKRDLTTSLVPAILAILALILTGVFFGMSYTGYAVSRFGITMSASLGWIFLVITIVGFTELILRTR